MDKDSIEYKMTDIAALEYKLVDIANGVRAEYGDSGSCVMGMNLEVDNIEYASQIGQGSLTNEAYLKRVKNMLKNNGISEDRIRINYGRMD